MSWNSGRSSVCVRVGVRARRRPFKAVTEKWLDRFFSNFVRMFLGLISPDVFFVFLIESFWAIWQAKNCCFRPFWDFDRCFLKNGLITYLYCGNRTPMTVFYVLCLCANSGSTAYEIMQVSDNRGFSVLALKGQKLHVICNCSCPMSKMSLYLLYDQPFTR